MNFIFDVPFTLWFNYNFGAVSFSMHNIYGGLI
ncbi:hypothetical protein JMJ77_0009178 [Colletotrichum scovillei]|uniref:Uncharacterized protein n=1 Tax=Colletotrichum scovillei TaxID=1209932 RepID=A0A9P7QZK4_9PEZI|nr:hypothetical protein JMJ77_0009178 [Colletotrichum scovillei]KAG7052253.1 hypothetical protein JMJ78_0005274 [Colletotrichum scovillei]KAG7064544.1 hypothetical protein JMJ76_0012307 [Colletotrichum scovillei]